MGHINNVTGIFFSPAELLAKWDKQIFFFAKYRMVPGFAAVFGSRNERWLTVILNLFQDLGFILEGIADQVRNDIFIILFYYLEWYVKEGGIDLSLKDIFR